MYLYDHKLMNYTCLGIIVRDLNFSDDNFVTCFTFITCIDHNIVKPRLSDY